MSDLGHKQTDEELKRIENVITKEYKQAAQDVEDKMLKHFDDFNAKDIMMRKKVDSGAITESQYNQWRIGQMATGERWISLRDSLTQTLVNADKVATQIIQGNSIKAYGDNMNYGTYEIEHGSKINTGFNLYDSNTVINLMKDDPKIVPMPRLDIPKDEQWNRQHLSSAVLQGILQGESIPKIADRLQNVAFMGRNSAIRNARTYTTAAENKGRIDSYERAENMGIKTNKKWIATLDDRTRAEHRHLDGMSVPYDSKFESDGYEIAFPGDPSAEPEMFYNCRCTLVADIVGYPYNDERKDDKLGDMSYEEWKHAKDKPEKEPEPIIEKPELKLYKLESAMKEKDFQDFYDMVDEAENRKLYEMFGDKGSYQYKSNGGCYIERENKIEFSYANSERDGVDKYSTLAHEFSHKADDWIGKNENLSYNEIDHINEKTGGTFIKELIKPCASNSDEFLSAMRSDMEELKVLYKQKPEEEHEKIRGEYHTYFTGKSRLGEIMFVNENAFNASRGIQDVLDGFYGGLGEKIGWGHGDRYYNREYNHKFVNWGKEKELKEALNELGFDASSQAKVKRITRQYEAASELWANVGSAITTKDDSLEMFEKYMPNTVKAYRSIVEEL